MQPTLTSRVSHETPTASFDNAGSSETARMLRTLLGNLDGMVYRCRDDAEWTMEFVSEGTFELTGYYPADLTVTRAVTYGALIRQMWWWFMPPIVVIVILFLGLFLMSQGLDQIANPRLQSKV